MLIIPELPAHKAEFHKSILLQFPGNPDMNTPFNNSIIQSVYKPGPLLVLKISDNGSCGMKEKLFLAASIICKRGRPAFIKNHIRDPIQLFFVRLYPDIRVYIF